MGSKNQSTQDGILTTRERAKPLGEPRASHGERINARAAICRAFCNMLDLESIIPNEANLFVSGMGNGRSQQRAAEQPKMET